MRNMLLSLRAREVEIVGLCALNFLHPSGTSMFTDLDEKLKGNETSFNLNDNNINFIYVRTKSRNLGDMISQEQRDLYAKFCAIINSFRPDVVMGSGTDMLSMVCFDEAHRRGIPTVYTLLDGTPRRFNFPNIDVVITDSTATANLYANMQKINVVPVGSFIPVAGPLVSREEAAKVITEAESAAKEGKINAEQVLARNPERNRITMISPTLDKGVTIFTKLSQVAPAEAQKFKFTVYETAPGQFKDNIAKATGTSFTEAELSKIEVLGPEVPSKEVLESTRLLVVPSLSFESIVTIAREAIAHGIPVLATNQIGIAESVGEAGVLVELPPTCVRDHSAIPSTEELANFIKGMSIVLSEDMSARCARVTQRNEVNFSANRLALILKPLFDKRAGNNPQLLRNGSLI